MAANDPSREALADWGTLVLRVSLSVLILLHGIAKVIASPAFVTGLVAKAGLPPALGYLVYVGEVVAPIPLIIGLWVQPAAIIVAINMLTAILLVHIGEIFSLNMGGGWAIELQGMFLIAAVSVALLGAGRLSMGGKYGRWN
jgi:putative oxidoreductase